MDGAAMIKSRPIPQSTHDINFIRPKSPKNFAKRVADWFRKRHEDTNKKCVEAGIGVIEADGLLHVYGEENCNRFNAMLIKENE
jgi:hypothetical protein